MSAQPSSKKRILVVCTANVCRSPLVAALLQRRIHESGLDHAICVESAGVRALTGYPVDPVIVAMLDEMGIAQAEKYATPVAESALQLADLVLVMEEAHRQALFYRLPGALPKIFLLSEMAGRNEEIADPHGQDEEAYRKALATVIELLDRGWAPLLKRLGINTPPAT